MCVWGGSLLLHASVSAVGGAGWVDSFLSVCVRARVSVWDVWTDPPQKTNVGHMHAPAGAADVCKYSSPPFTVF